MSTLSRLKSCSLDKLQLLLDRLDAEENNLVQERRKLEGLIDKAYAKTSDDILKIHNGDYLIDVEILEIYFNKFSQFIDSKIISDTIINTTGLFVGIGLHKIYYK